MRRTATLTIPTLAAAIGLTLAGASAEATTSADGDVIEEHVDVQVMLDGPMSQVRGNQHRLIFETDAEGVQWPRGKRKIVSYFCPSGATVNTRWVSSRCVFRSTVYLDHDRSDYRVSSTMRSAVVDGPLEGAGRTFPSDLVLRADGWAWTGEWVGGTRLRQTHATVSGRVDGAKVRWNTREDSFIHRIEATR
ncbi:hypothetical protein NMQ01_01745 [Janibacter sp. CX7]|uniref:hypothetical protein n=1 Tax=Janibacter sp. CX7 TaxID=2963431 RepID=UPI0020CC5214|nr:hypothetical protein [Janibacter sp. CX7]UTT66462.1 hypothetical protein NMQ01_01745 [Janibacter sp. CX7]